VGHGGEHDRRRLCVSVFHKLTDWPGHVGILVLLSVSQELVGKLDNKMLKSTNTQVLSANTFSTELFRIYFI